MKKIIGLIFSLLIFSGCGFSPVYSPSAEMSAPSADVYVATISGTNGIDLRNSLRAKFETDNNIGAKYTLKVDLQKPQTAYKAIQITGDATWQEVRMTATYVLTETNSGREILNAKDTASESYTFVRDLVAAQASYNNAVQSTLRLLSEKIVTRINAELATGDGK